MYICYRPRNCVVYRSFYWSNLPRNYIVPVNDTGKGFIRSHDGETVTYTFKAGGQLDKLRNIAIRGTLNFNSIPTGNLAFLGNVKGILKGEVTNKGQLTFQVWQQK